MVLLTVFMPTILVRKDHKHYWTVTLGLMCYNGR
jgi:hypothetical protein